MARPRSISTARSDSTHRTAAQNEMDHQDAFAARGADGENGPAKGDVEKGGGDDRGARAGGDGQDEKGEPERIERDADGVAVENGVPLLRMTGPDDPLS